MHTILLANNKDRLQWQDNQFPLVSAATTDPQTDERQKVERVESRVLELESLLKDYFLDSAYLARLKNLQDSEKLKMDIA